MHIQNSERDPGPTAANERQIGGDHYKKDRTGLQHWDIVHLLAWDYFQGNITKYVDRHAKKKGLQDLLKAEHYLHKYMELKYPEEYALHLAREQFKEDAPDAFRVLAAQYGDTAVPYSATAEVFKLQMLTRYSAKELMDELRRRADLEESQRMEEFLAEEQRAHRASHDPDTVEPRMCKGCGFDDGLHHPECPDQIADLEGT